MTIQIRVLHVYKAESVMLPVVLSAHLPLLSGRTIFSVVSACFIADLSKCSTPLRRFWWVFSCCTAIVMQKKFGQAKKKTSAKDFQSKKKPLTFLIGKRILLLSFSVFQFAGIEVFDAGYQSLLSFFSRHIWKRTFVHISVVFACLIKNHVLNEWLIYIFCLNKIC